MPARIHANLENGQTFRLTGNTRPMLAVAEDQGEVDATTTLPRMTMHLAMTAAQQADLAQLLQQQVTRNSSLYHKWLTTDEYAARFGANSSDVQKITSWLEGRGFTNVEVAKSRGFVTFSGSASQVQAAFQTSIHRYNKGGEAHFANASDPILPKALQGMVAGIRGLNDMHPKPHSRVRPHFTSSISGSHFLTPDDFATIYDLQALYGSGINGAGQKIAIPGQSDIALADIEAFRAAAGLTANDPQVLLTGTDPGVSSSDQSESELDLEWAGGVARNATIIFVNSTDVFNSLTYAIDNNVAPVISVTYGDCESDLGSAEVTSLNSVFQQAAVQGISLLAASGDQGAADCDSGSSNTAVDGPAVDFPASSPYVTGVGGTTLSEGSGTYWNATNDAYSGSAISYIPEVAWNDTLVDGISGGGASIFFTKPVWQAGTGVPNDGFRDVPDVAFVASPNHDGYLVCTGGGSCATGFRYADTTLDVVGGTSAAAPSFAGIIALLNQQTSSTQGTLNAHLYALASYSSTAFHDVTSGNNIVACRAGTAGCPASLQFGFSAGTGYDQVTGLGSVDGNNLVSQWTSYFGISIAPGTLALTRGNSGAATVTIAKEGAFTGTVSFTCSVAGTLTNTTCSIPGTVTGSGTATLTVTAGASATTPSWRNVIKPSGDGGLWFPGKAFPVKTFPINSRLALLALAGLLVCGAGYLMAEKKRGMAVVLASAFSLMLVLSGCGDGGGSTTSSVGTTSPTLSLTASPATLSLGPGQSGTSTATLTTGGTLTSAIALSVSGAPSGVTATLGSASVAGSSSVPLTVAVGSGVAAGTYPLTITASGSGVSATTVVTLTVSAQTGIVTVTAKSGTLTNTSTLTVTLN